ncbi:MAG TPA: BPSS1780 family membrane protein [Casimicrobiaceae bacterium]|nr:BPSS1780 family membrane protein [Casimicrobiaceae bacterium]
MANESTASVPAIPPVPAAPEPRTVAAGRGVSWWIEGWRLFTPSVANWLLISLVLCAAALIASAAGTLPVLGQLIALAGEVLWPLFIGGLMVGCRAIDRGNPLLFAHLVAGFSQRAGALLKAGIIYTVLLVVISVAIGGIMIAIFGVSILGVITGSTDWTQEGIAFSSAVVAVLLGFLFFLLLLVPLVMAIWFAPALIMLGGMDAPQAMKASFAGCLRNVVPFLAYGAIGIVLVIVASIPFGLGWLVLVPVSVTSIYASYCDIFEDRDSG